MNPKLSVEGLLRLLAAKEPRYKNPINVFYWIFDLVIKPSKIECVTVTN